MTKQGKTYKVLIIDDDPSLREALKDTLHEQNGWCVKEAEFDQVENLLHTFQPDMIVLDLILGQVPDGNPVGNAFFEKIREIWFCPIVVYSAAISMKKFEHPLVETVNKGQDSDMEVIKYLNKFQPIIEQIHSTHSHFDAKIRRALHDSARYLPDDSCLAGDRQVLMRNVRRLVAARTDMESEEGIKAWERFVMPPLGEHLLTADLLRRQDKDWHDEEAFRLVLTPSCDMVRREGQSAKVNQILVACCEPLEKLGNMDFKSGNNLSKKQIERLKNILVQGMADSHIPIPFREKFVPIMAANLKRLELIDWDNLSMTPEVIASGGNDYLYERVASTDSPFREMVVWAYLRVSGRPGLPEMDAEDWLGDILRWLTEAKES